jgi:hypothetical protein
MMMMMMIIIMHLLLKYLITITNSLLHACTEKEIRCGKIISDSR